MMIGVSLLEMQAVGMDEKQTEMPEKEDLNDGEFSRNAFLMKKRLHFSVTQPQR